MSDRMRKPLTRLMLLIALTVVLTSIALAQSGGGYDLTWNTVDGGGGTSVGGVYELSGTAGQPDAGTLSGGSYTLAGGFWGGTVAVAAQYRLYLPLIVKGYTVVHETELAYDSGAGTPDASWEVGKGFAVRFTPPATPATLVRARFYFHCPCSPVEVHVWDAGRNSLGSPVLASPTQEGWFEVNLSGQNITVNGDFYVGFLHIVDYQPTLGSDFSAPDGRSYEVDGHYWEQQMSKDYLIRATVR